MVTELTQYSLHVTDQPVYLLVLDAQSAYDRCLTQVLCTELFMSGVTGSALLLLNNRLENRSTVYQWEGEMLGPAVDKTGFEQGGINSGDFYKLYNNEQLKSAQDSELGVNIGSSVVSAIGQADDVILAANNVSNLKLLARLTEVYCRNYRVQLVASKTKLLPIFLPRHSFLVEYAKLVNTVTVNNTVVEFVSDAEHVGVIRSSTGNMPNILHRVTCYKKALMSVSSSGISRTQRGNPAASLRVHQLYAVPVLLSGLGSLVLQESEVKIIDSTYKNTVQSLQRLHKNTPRGVVFLLAGCLPGRAALHCKQLSLFLMITHLPGNPLHSHATHVLTGAPESARSWFQQVRNICALYGLPAPLHLLQNPPDKAKFKLLVKAKVAQYWHGVFSEEISGLKSLKYFRPELYSLLKPHYMWSLTASNPFESVKSTVLARMASGRFRTEMLTRYWSKNRSGYCRAPHCVSTPGTLEHLLATCPALSLTRERLYQMWLEQSVMFPTLHATIRRVLESPVEDIVQFVLEPLAFPDILSDFKSHGRQYAHQLSYLTRTFAFNMNREYQRFLKSINDPTQHQVSYQTHTNPFYFSVVSCDDPSLADSGDQDNTVPPGGSSAVAGQATTTLARTTSTGQEIYQSVLQCVPVPISPPLHISNVVNDKPGLPGPSCVLPPVPCSPSPSNVATASQRARFPASNFPAAQLTSSLSTTSDTTLQSLLPSMASQYQHQDYTGDFCGGWGNYDQVIQVSP